MTQYIHAPLSSRRSTRVLLFQPSTDHCSPLVGELQEGNFQEDLAVWNGRSYEALSYVWGPPSLTHYISIHARKLPITANCDAALRRLRNKQTTRTLWVDAICIDQRPEGLAERSAVVAMMGEIFEAAQMTILWLGEGDEGISALLQCFDRHIKHTGSDIVSKAFDASALATLCKTAKSLNTTPAEIFNEVAYRPWFKRMWTLQELLLSSESIIMCGKDSIPWKHFQTSIMPFVKIEGAEAHVGMGALLSCASIYMTHGKPALDVQRAETNNWRKDNTQPAGPMSQTVSHFDTMPNDLTTLLTEARIRQASKLEDKVFALYSIARAAGKTLPVPDYSKAIYTIFTDATIACLNQDQSYSVLECVWSMHRMSGLPSWVPDWSDIDYMHPPLQQDVGVIGAEVEWPNNQQAGPCTVSDGSKLHLQGKVLGRIAEVSAGIDVKKLDRDIGVGDSKELRRKIFQIRTLLKWRDFAMKNNYNQDAIYAVMLNIAHMMPSNEFRTAFDHWSELIDALGSAEAREGIIDLLVARFGPDSELLEHTGAFDKNVYTLLAAIVSTQPRPSQRLSALEIGAAEFFNEIRIDLYCMDVFVTHDHLGAALGPLARVGATEQEYVLVSAAYAHGVEFLPEEMEDGFSKFVLV